MEFLSVMGGAALCTLFYSNLNRETKSCTLAIGFLLITLIFYVLKIII